MNLLSVKENYDAMIRIKNMLLSKSKRKNIQEFII